MSDTTKQDEPGQNVIVRAPRQPILVESAVPIFDTARFEHYGRVAKFMAQASLLPNHVKGRNIDETFGNCFLIVSQADRFGMDPFALAQATFVLNGRIGYEGKLIAALIETKVGHPFDYEWSGTPGDDKYKILVTNRRRKDGKEVSIDGTVGDWKTFEKFEEGKPRVVKANWRGLASRNQLAYRGVREWARLYEPALMLGVYTPDEMDDLDEDFRARQARDITPRSGPPEPEDEEKPLRSRYHQQEPAPDPDEEDDGGDRQQDERQQEAEKEPAKQERKAEPAKKQEPEKKVEPKKQQEAKPAADKKAEPQESKPAADLDPSVLVGQFKAFIEKLESECSKAKTMDELKAVWKARQQFAGRTKEQAEHEQALLNRHKARVAKAEVDQQKAAVDAETQNPPEPEDDALDDDAGGGEDKPGLFEYAGYLDALANRIDACQTVDEVTALVESDVAPFVDKGLVSEDQRDNDIMPLVTEAIARLES